MPVALDIRPAAVASLLPAAIPDGRTPFGHAAKPPPATTLAEGWANLEKTGVHVLKSKRRGIEAQMIELGRIMGREPSAASQKFFDSLPFFNGGQQGPGIARRLYERGKTMAETGQGKAYLWGEAHSCGKTLPAIAEALRLAPENGVTHYISELGPADGRAALIAGSQILKQADKAGGLYRWAAELSPDELDTKMSLLMPALAERAGLELIFAGGNDISEKLNVEGVSASMATAARKVLDAGGAPFVLCGSAHMESIGRRLGKKPVGSAKPAPCIVGHVFAPTTMRNSKDPRVDLRGNANPVSFVNGSLPPTDPPRYEIHKIPPGVPRQVEDVAAQTVDDTLRELADGHMPSVTLRALEKMMRNNLEKIEAVTKLCGIATRIGSSQVRQKNPAVAARRNTPRVPG
jgi:hypothetical protein